MALVVTSSKMPGVFGVPPPQRGGRWSRNGHLTGGSGASRECRETSKMRKIPRRGFAHLRRKLIAQRETARLTCGRRALRAQSTGRWTMCQVDRVVKERVRLEAAVSVAAFCTFVQYGFGRAGGARGEESWPRRDTKMHEKEGLRTLERITN